MGVDYRRSLSRRAVDYNRREDVQNVQRLASNYYITNIPEGWSSKGIWNRLQVLGSIADVYLAGKRNRSRSIFGFARFMNVLDPEKLEKMLNEVRLGEMRLVANLSKFYRRKDWGGDIEKPKSGGSNNLFEVGSGVSKLVGNGRCNGRSYVSVAKGEVIGRLDQETVGENVEKIIVPDSSSPRPKEWFNRCLVAEVKTLEILLNIFSLLKMDGLFNCCIKYFGGLNVLVQFQSKDEGENILANYADCWMKWFAWARRWIDSFVQKHRISWLKIFRVSVQFHDETLFSCVQERVGRSLWPYFCSDDDKNFSYGRACVLVNQFSFINKNFEVCWKGSRLSVWVTEEWTLVFKDGGSEADSDNEDMGEENLVFSEDEGKTCHEGCFTQKG
ncbi:uncharacterized protein LOC143601957 [Bidens hawaiensis]|uniref:uncharacterized protein LOC143601957 n=1 Tax=Bidens hawaiensis TaxID=980011 RepID=UPI00404B89D4